MNDDIRIRRLPPVWFIKIINTLRSGLLKLNRRMFPGSIVLYEHFQYLWLLPCIRVAAGLNIAGILKEYPRTIDELAVLTGSKPEFLFRIMRALTSNDIFKLRKDGRYVNSSMSKALIDGKGSLRNVILQHLGSFNWGALSELGHTVRTGEDAVSKLYGKGIYDYLAGRADESEIFSRSMSDLAELSADPVLNSYDFSKYKSIADIGGGEGLLISAIVFNNPGTTGILFDRPESIANAPAVFERYALKDKIRIVPGDFFESAPAGAKVYLLKNILHNWGDQDCSRILGNIKKVIPDDGKVLIVEMVIHEDSKPSFGKLIDIQMMATMKDGKERTRKEYEAILNQSGFRINKIIPTIAPISIIEAIRS